MSKRINYEKPEWAERLQTVVRDNLSRSLPTPVYNRGYKLHFVEYDIPHDPVFLYARNGRIVHEWPYVPSLAEVFELCKTLEVEQ